MYSSSLDAHVILAFNCVRQANPVKIKEVRRNAWRRAVTDMTKQGRL